MIKSLLIWFLCFFFPTYCWSQPGFLKSETVKIGIINTQNISNTEKQSGNTVKDTVVAPKLLLDVLFATNEDCDLYVNEEWRGAVSKSEFQYLKLAPGNYIYRAKSKATLDELKDTFTVTEGRMNELFMDLLYLVDEKNFQRETFKNRVKVTLQPLVLNEKTLPGSKPEERKKAEEITTINDLTGSMIIINEGTFVMGNNKAPFPDEIEHPVRINTVFFSKYEVTQQQWQSIMGYNFSINKGCSTCPVENISWEEAMKFIRKINVISSKKFRLPREAEWEYVARMGGKTEIENAGGQEEYIKKTTWYFGNSAKKTHPVGMKQPNISGVYDLLGNVSEWCSDWYDSYYYKEDFNQIDPEGPPLGKEKVIRGGNFSEYSGDRFRPSLRNKKNPIEKNGLTGLRLVLELKD